MAGSAQPSLAERYRAHRAEMELAQELGCTPLEARHELNRRAARDSWQQTEQRLRAKMDRQPCRRSAAVDAPRDDAWMMRD